MSAAVGGWGGVAMAMVAMVMVAMAMVEEKVAVVAFAVG